VIAGRAALCNQKNFWKFTKQIEELGFDLDDFNKPKAWIGDNLALALGAANHLQYVKQIKKRTNTTIYICVQRLEEMKIILKQAEGFDGQE